MTAEQAPIDRPGPVTAVTGDRPSYEEQPNVTARKRIEEEDVEA